MLATMFLQGTKLEAVAYGDQTISFNSLLGLGEAFDFLRIDFAPTYVDLALHFSVYVLTTMSFYRHKLWLMHHRELCGLLSFLVPLWKSRMYTIRMSPFL